jgi:hypothetical protein
MNFEQCSICGEFGLSKLCGDCQIGNITARRRTANCVHCETPFTSLGDECPICDLNQRRTYPSAEIAFLWKSSSGIRKAMEAERPLLSGHSSIGKFLRTGCGPHCFMEVNCSQDLHNLISCARRAGKIGNSSPIRLQPKLEEGKKPPQTYFRCSPGGWFASMHEDYYIKPSQNPEPGA